jgi:hypothetical protein
MNGTAATIGEQEPLPSEASTPAKMGSGVCECQLVPVGELYTQFIVW